MQERGHYLCSQRQDFVARAASGVGWQRVEAVQVLDPPDPVGIYGSVPFDSAYRMLAGKSFSLPEVGCLHLEDAYVAGYGLVTSGDSALLDPNFTIAFEELGLYGYFTEVERIEGFHIRCEYKESCELPEAVVLLHRGDTVHGHWLLEVLPRVLLSKKAGLRDPFYIVSSQIRDYQIEMLEAVGVRREKIVRIAGDERIRCLKLVVPSVAHANMLWLHPFANETFDHLIGHAAEQAVGDRQYEKLYITRNSRHDDPRAVLNNNEIEGVLRKAGYQTIDSGQVHWREQVRLFSGARAIVGIGGSGLHNTAFTGAAAKVLTLQPNQNWNYLQASIAAIRGHEHSFFFGESMSAFDESTWETPFIIDRELLALVV